MFVEVCRRRGLKVNVGKRKVMVLNGEEGLDYDVHVNGICLEHVSNIRDVLGESGIDKAQNVIGR